MQPDEDVRAVTLASAIDFEGFRRACRALWADQVGPDRVSWSTAQDPEADLIGPERAAGAAKTFEVDRARQRDHAYIFIGLHVGRLARGAGTRATQAASRPHELRRER